MQISPMFGRHIAACWQSGERDIASLAVFRIGFGLLMAVALIRYWAKGFFAAQLVEPRFHFTYELFSFVRPLPEPWLSGLLVALVLSALCIALGLFYRAAMLSFGLGFAYFELIDRATYLNHYYLVSLLCFLLLFVPAGDALSLDAVRRRHARASVPAWMLWTMRAQIAVVYSFAGIAKLNADWLWHAQPLRIWLAAQRDFPVLGVWLSESWAAYILSWGGAAFDLTIVGFLLWSRTRPYAYALLVFFHLITGLWFPIGIFPWLMIVASTLFFAPDWPRHAFHLASEHAAVRSAANDAPEPQYSWLKWLFATHLALQVALPLHLHLRGADAAWSGNGFNFAWKVMLAERAGAVTFRVRDAQRQHEAMLSPSRYLTPSQVHAMAQDPQLVRAFARHIADSERARGRNVSVYADAFLSLNGRPARRVIDPTFDLASDSTSGFVLPR